MDSLGILTLIPPIAIITIAVTTKKTSSSLLIGVLLCCVLQSGTGFLDTFIDLIYRVGTSSDTIWIIVFTAIFGIFIQLISISKGERAFLYAMGRLAKTPRRTMLLSWIAGLVVFFDDFTSVAIRGMMTKLYDRQKLPRAMLSYITDATGSPLCILIPFGTWAVFYQSLFSSYAEVTSLGPVMDTYTKAIPLMFYGWAALIISLLAACQLIKPMGAMKKAFIRAETTGQLYGPESAAYNNGDGGDIPDEMGKKEFVQGAVCFLVPILVLIITALVTLDALKAVIIAVGVMIPLYLALRVVSWGDMMDASMKGIVSMTSMSVIVFMAYMLKEAITDIGLPTYVISLVAPVMSPALLPLITFMACVALTFTTGSNWGGTVGVTAIVIPLAAVMGASIPLTLAAIVSGAAFGAHVCFYTDVTVFTSTMTRIDNQEHAVTQLPYGLLGMLISAAAYAVAGYMAI